MKLKLAVTMILAAALAASPLRGAAPPLRASTGLARKASFGIPLGTFLARARMAGRGVRPQVVYSDSAENDEFLIAGAGSVAGAYGTYFRTDVTLVNFDASDQDIAVYWLAEGQDNTSVTDQHFVIPAGTVETETDFVGSVLGKSGLGAILVYATDAKGNLDLSANIDGASRTWTDQPNSSGTVSLSFPPVSLYDSVNDFPAWTYGLRQDSQFRTNVGIVNLDATAHTWTISVIAKGGVSSFTVPVPPNSMVQAPLPAGSPGFVGVAFQPDATGFAWSAYSVSVDDITGDGWVEHARQ